MISTAPVTPTTPTVFTAPIPYPLLPTPERKATCLPLGEGREAEAAKDAAQSGFIKAYYALNRFRSGAPFRPWLLKIVANEARNQARSASRRTGRELQLAEGRPRDDAAPSPEEAALAALNREALLRAVNALDANARQVIAYRYFLDLSEAEMADALDCRRGTVKSRLSRAVGRLRETLAGDTSELVDEKVHHE